MSGEWFIEAGQQEGLPAYYSPKIARMLGGDLGWSRNKAEAQSWPSKAEALAFARQRMPTAVVRIVKVAVE